MPEKTVIQLAVYRQVYWNKFFEGTKAGCPKILGQVFSLHSSEIASAKNCRTTRLFRGSET